MGLSSLTTYLTFFDASYTLTAATAEVPVQVQRGGSSSGDQRSAYFRFFAEPTVILSNRGKLALVVSNLRAYRSVHAEECQMKEGDSGKTSFAVDGNRPAVPRVVEPETLQHLKLSFGLDNIEANISADETFAIPDDQQLWCLRWTIFDPNGTRHEVDTPLVTLDRTFATVENERYPIVEVDKDFPRGPRRLVSRSLL